MAYEKMTIADVLANIIGGKMYLPAIQRKYVWSEYQITRLMDSIMLGYPIGTFLFWKVKKKVINEKGYSMYQFIKDYHERDCANNPPAPNPLFASNSAPDETIQAVLDGQQRLTSLYIALQGTFSTKLPKKHWSNDEAYPLKELYIDLRYLGGDADNDMTYRFAFLTEQAVNAVDSSNPDNPLWYKVKDILSYRSQAEINSKLVLPRQWINEKPNVTETLMILFEQLVKEELINYFEIKQFDSIDDVLDIFIRVNSGGTTLSKTDLLYSTIVCHWDGARDEVDKLLSAVNRVGNGFQFSNDFIMRTCLYLLGQNISLKVESFKKENVLAIKEEWKSIKDAVLSTAELLNEFGFYDGNITSYAAVIPIVYYKYCSGAVDGSTKQALRKYFIMAQLQKVFGASNTTALNRVRTALDEMAGKFNYSILENIRFPGDKMLRCTDANIEEWIDSYEIGPYTFMLLSLLYPNFKYGQVGFHQDHLHPYAGFEADNLDGLVLPDGSTMTPDRIQKWKYLRNTLPNLQLLEGRENESKNKAPLAKWLNVSQNKDCVKYLPENVSFDLSHFEEFYEARRTLLLNELKRILL